LWLAYVNLEIEEKNFARARTIMEKAKMNIPNSEELWYQSVKLEEVYIINLYCIVK
jgi:hypothetical protein